MLKTDLYSAIKSEDSEALTDVLYSRTRLAGTLVYSFFFKFNIFIVRLHWLHVMILNSRVAANIALNSVSFISLQ